MAFGGRKLHLSSKGVEYGPGGLPHAFRYLHRETRSGSNGSDPVDILVACISVHPAPRWSVV